MSGTGANASDRFVMTEQRWDRTDGGVQFDREGEHCRAAPSDPRGAGAHEALMKGTDRLGADLLRVGPGMHGASSVGTLWLVCCSAGRSVSQRP